MLHYLTPVGSRHARVATAFIVVEFVAAALSTIAAFNHWGALLGASAIVLVVFGTDMFLSSLTLRRMIQFRELQESMRAARADR